MLFRSNKVAIRLLGSKLEDYGSKPDHASHYYMRVS